MLTRLIDASRLTLKDFKCNYKLPALGQALCVSLCKCRVLTHVEFGQCQDNIEKATPMKLQAIKFYIRKKHAKLECLRLYECDQELLELLSLKDA